MDATQNSRKQRRRAEFVLRAIVSILPLTMLLALLPGCGRPKQAPVDVPPPPASTPEPSPTESASRPEGAAKNDRLPGSEENDAALAEPTIPADATPIATETGRASWYGPPYHNRVGSNGEVYNMHAMTAAHRTLPLGAIVRVTNLTTGHTALVRITDRGPFIPGRILDLSLAAARKLDVYLPGVAEVKVEVMQTPAPLETGGKWAVQIGGFPREREANELADHLTRRYRTAKVLRFASPAGDWWVRVRLLDDDRERARQLAAETETTEGAVFLVRLD
ncbi:MAG: septal ring lytic transglycosylase RlpA family protein [Candidatus Sulfotelmatobacter sp.]